MAVRVVAGARTLAERDALQTQSLKGSHRETVFMQELLLMRLGALAWLAPVVAGIWILNASISAWLRLRNPVLDMTADKRSLATDLGYIAISPISEALSRLFTTGGLALCALALGHRLGPDLIDGFGPVAAQPRWLIYVEVILLGDLIFYWTHRLAHTVPWMWRFHAIHHSTRHMRATSALRAHPGEAYVQLIQMVPLYLMGFPLEVLISILPVAMLYAMLIHSNAPLRLGPLRYVLNSPAFHRWHHALDVRDGTRNYAGWFPAFDLLFGSFTMPDHAPPELGIDDPNMPETCEAQLLYPFRRSGDRKEPWKTWVRKLWTKRPTAHTS